MRSDKPTRPLGMHLKFDTFPVTLSSRLRKKGKALRRSGWSPNSFGGAFVIS